MQRRSISNNLYHSQTINRIHLIACSTPSLRLSKKNRKIKTFIPFLSLASLFIPCFLSLSFPHPSPIFSTNKTQVRNTYLPFPNSLPPHSLLSSAINESSSILSTNPKTKKPMNFKKEEGRMRKGMEGLNNQVSFSFIPGTFDRGSRVSLNIR